MGSKEVLQAGSFSAPMDESTAERFYDHKEKTRKRLGWDELRNEEFIEILLDVQALHLEDGEVR